MGWHENTAESVAEGTKPGKETVGEVCMSSRGAEQGGIAAQKGSTGQQKGGTRQQKAAKSSKRAGSAHVARSAGAAAAAERRGAPGRCLASRQITQPSPGYTSPYLWPAARERTGQKHVGMEQHGSQPSSGGE